jgi:hypothetical protein
LKKDCEGRNVEGTVWDRGSPNTPFFDFFAVAFLPQSPQRSAKVFNRKFSKGKVEIAMIASHRYGFFLCVLEEGLWGKEC